MNVELGDEEEVVEGAATATGSESASESGDVGVRRPACTVEIPATQWASEVPATPPPCYDDATRNDANP